MLCANARGRDRTANPTANPQTIDLANPTANPTGNPTVVAAKWEAGVTVSGGPLTCAQGPLRSTGPIKPSRPTLTAGPGGQLGAGEVAAYQHRLPVPSGDSLSPLGCPRACVPCATYPTVLRLFTCPAITVATVTLRAFDRVRERALGCLALDRPNPIFFKK